jgi:hypothetical protein
MAKEDEARAPKSKMTPIMLQLDGGEETLQQSFTTIGQALGNAFQHVKQLSGRPLPLAGVVLDQQADTELLEASDQEPANNSHDEAPPRSRARSVPKSPEVLDLELDKGNPPLKESFGYDAAMKTLERRWLAPVRTNCYPRPATQERR